MNTEILFNQIPKEPDSWFGDENCNEVDRHIKSLKLPSQPSSARLDKVTITDIEIVFISDIDRLIANGMVDLCNNVNHRIYTAPNAMYSRLQIKGTALFDNFVQRK